MKQLIFVLLICGLAFAKGKPEEFTITANVIAVNSFDVTTGVRTQPPLDSGNPTFDKAYNAAYGTRTTVEHRTVFVLVTEIGDNIYELSSSHMLELGTYKARSDSKGFYFQYSDKNGKVKSTRLLRIVSVKTKPKKD